MSPLFQFPEIRSISSVATEQQLCELDLATSRSSGDGHAVSDPVVAPPWQRWNKNGRCMSIRTLSNLPHRRPNINVTVSLWSGIGVPEAQHVGLLLKVEPTFSQLSTEPGQEEMGRQLGFPFSQISIQIDDAVCVGPSRCVHGDRAVQTVKDLCLDGVKLKRFDKESGG
jgi:hypothetical protein